MNLDYDRFQLTDVATERILGRILQITLIDLERSAGQDCHTCTILRGGIQAVCPDLCDGESGNLPIVIRLQRGQSLELRIGDIVDCDTVEFFTHFGTGIVHEKVEQDRLTFIDQPGSWAAFGPAQDVPTQLDLTTCLEKVRRWIEFCNNNHRLCSSPPAPKLPTRVLDVGNPENQEPVKIYETRGNLGRYVTLSHCWGNQQITTTTKATLAQLKSEVRWSQLSKTFQEAISITRELGIRYIWIDSFCIYSDRSYIKHCGNLRF